METFNFTLSRKHSIGMETFNFTLSKRFKEIYANVCQKQEINLFIHSNGNVSNFANIFANMSAVNSFSKSLKCYSSKNCQNTKYLRKKTKRNDGLLSRVKL